LHRQVWLAIRPMPCVDQARNVGMRQMSENLALLQKALPRGAGIQGGAQQFDGNSLPHLPIRPFGEIHNAHSAAADHAQKLEGTAIPAIRYRLLKRDTHSSLDNALDRRASVE